MKHSHFLLIAALAIGCSESSEQATVRSVALTVALPDAPWYALDRCDSHGGGFSADATYADTVVTLFKPAPWNAPGNLPIHAVVTPSLANPQGLVAGATATGGAFVLVVSVDYMLHQSRLELFTDISGNGVPDQLSAIVLATYTGRHLVRPAYDPVSGTMYLYDGYTDSILQFRDANADLIPDTTAMSTFLAAGGVGGAPLDTHSIGAPTATSFKLYRRNDLALSNPYSYTVITDTDANNVADQAVPAGPVGFHTTTEWGDFIGPCFAGSLTATVHVHGTGTYAIKSETPAGIVTTLATFTGATAGQQVVTYITTPTSGDELFLFDNAASVELAREFVYAAGTTLVLKRTAPTILDPHVNGTLTWSGVNISATDTVDAREFGTTGAWTVCTISAQTSTAISITVPNLVPSGYKAFEFRITTANGTFEFLHDVQASPQ